MLSPLDYRGFCLARLFFAAFFTSLPMVPAQEKPSRPNVLLIVSDDQGLGDLAHMGNPILKTPHLDELHSKSTRLTNFLVSPLCSPSRASIMTGRYNYRTGVWDTWQGGAVLNPSEKTLAEYLREAGYRTGHFGKWHLGENAPARPQDQGFETTVEFSGSRTDPDMEVNGKTVQGKGFCEDILFAKAIDFITARSDQPFFAMVASYMPHDYGGPGKPVPEEWVAPYRNQPGLQSGDQEIYGMVANLDHHVDQLLDALRSSGRESDTFVIFLSDNGPLRDCPELNSFPEKRAIEEHRIGSRYNAGLRGGKTTVFRGGVAAPCFIRLPGHIPENLDIDVLAAHIDLVPTILGLCGLAPVFTTPLDGIDLAPYLLGNTSLSPPDRAIVIQQDRNQIPQKWSHCSVRRGEWKLLDGQYLYNEKSDLSESDDVARKYPEIVAQLRSDYENWWKDITAKDPFHTSLTNLGSPEQEKASLHIYQRPPPGGWPVRFISDGIYAIEVQGIQNELLQPNSQVVLTVGSESHRQAVQNSADAVIFFISKPEKSETTLDVRLEPAPKPARMYYGNQDLGWRCVVVQLDKTKSRNSH